MTNPTKKELEKIIKKLNDGAKLDLTERIILISIINDRIKEKNVN